MAVKKVKLVSSRQAINILELLYSERNGFSSAEIQKLLFVYSMEIEDKPTFEFIPSKNGCYSPSLSRALQKLQDQHLVKSVSSDGETRLTLTVEGRWCAMGLTSASKMDGFLKNYTLRGDELLSDVYHRFPYWAIKCSPAIVPKTDEASFKDKHILLASIGYQNRTFENYLNALIKNDIDILCDVRKNPVSRIYGFSKSTLKTACDYLEIEYRHYPDLGIPGFERMSLESQEDYDELFARYEKSVLPKAEKSLNELIAFVQSGKSIALTCFEEKPEQCHRTRVLNYIAKKTASAPKLI